MPAAPAGAVKERRMQSSAQENYLVGEVMTAAPQKLQLLLIETSIRLVQRTKQHWHEGENERACETLIRAQQIIAQILSGLNRDAAPALAAKVAAVYSFVFRRLAEAGFTRDLKHLDDVLRVLEEERITWRTLCERLGAASGGPEAPAGAAPAPLARVSTAPLSGEKCPAGISLDA
jgi:flagellar protein FliS